MKSHRVNNLNNFIGGWYIDKDLCQKIIEDYDSRRDQSFDGGESRGYRYLPSFDMSVDLITEYELQVTECLKEYNELYEYSKKTISAYEMYSPFNVQRYEYGRNYSVWHCENNGEPQYRKRHLSFLTYLNTVSDGGETEFLYQNLKVRPEQGLTLIWPAGFTHIHRGIPANSEIKYITQGWYTYFDTESFLHDNMNLSDEEFFGKIDQLV